MNALTNSQIAVIYLATGGIAGGIFVFASFWIFHYVDLDDIETTDEIEPEIEATMLRDFKPFQI